MKKLALISLSFLFVFQSFGQTQNKTSFNKSLTAQLDTIHEDDQKYRRLIMEIIDESGWTSDNMELITLSITKEEKDSINLLKVEKILSEYGWLGSDIIGDQGNKTLFLVIQHSDLKTQEKYLPMMKEAVMRGDAKSNDFALLEDRVALSRGKKQIYGSQVGHDSETGLYFVRPLIDPENVDKRRLEMGLKTMQEYLSNYNMSWDAKSYKKRLPEYEMMEERL